MHFPCSAINHLGGVKKKAFWLISWRVSALWDEQLHLHSRVLTFAASSPLDEVRKDDAALRRRSHVSPFRFVATSRFNQTIWSIRSGKCRRPLQFFRRRKAAYFRSHWCQHSPKVLKCIKKAQGLITNSLFQRGIKYYLWSGRRDLSSLQLLLPLLSIQMTRSEPVFESSKRIWSVWNSPF